MQTQTHEGAFLDIYAVALSEALARNDRLTAALKRIANRKSQKDGTILHESPEQIAAAALIEEEIDPNG